MYNLNEDDYDDDDFNDDDLVVNDNGNLPSWRWCKNFSQIPQKCTHYPQNYSHYHKKNLFLNVLFILN